MFLFYFIYSEQEVGAGDPTSLSLYMFKMCICVWHSRKMPLISEGDNMFQGHKNPPCNQGCAGYQSHLRGTSLERRPVPSLGSAKPKVLALPQHKASMLQSEMIG